MQVTQFTDYAVRTLIYLCLQPDRRATVEEIAARLHVSASHLTKVVHRLGRIGVIETLRGRRGGLRLHMAPDQISAGWLFRQTEDNLALADCFQSGGCDCPLSGNCQMTGILQEALQAFLAVLDRYSLADLMRDQALLRQLLGQPPAEPSAHLPKAAQ
ncbi:MAG: Rrf2 family transcriptional regulator [Rhodospirillaceae bacterium]|nr:MAG: Rrf2 family transcriptional regulator [Rhodospirillaceae bacterium]